MEYVPTHECPGLPECAETRNHIHGPTRVELQIMYGERCEVTELIKNQCAHCLKHKDAEEEEDELNAEMVSNLLRLNREAT